MNLSVADRKYLLEKVYCGDTTAFESDLPQIEEAADYTKYTLYHGDVYGGRIARARAIKLCGMEGWLSGISRATFHWAAMRETNKPNDYVLFDASQIFK